MNASQSSVNALEKNPDPEAANRSTVPHRGTEGYAGSDACKECHKDEFQSWHRSYHRTMTQVASEESVKADFNNVVLENETTRFRLFKRDGEPWVRMEPIARPPGETGPADGLETRLGLVTGSHHMQVFWVPEGTGNMQLGFPFTWLIPEKRWVPRNSTFLRPPDMVHLSEVWNVNCSRCHTTGVEPRVDFASRRIETRVGELGIACEACHSPGQRHVELRTAAASSSSRGMLLPNEIVHPEKLSAARVSQVCGFCHSMKWIDPSWRKHGFEYRPGDDLEKTTPIISPSRTNDIPALADYLRRNPQILEDFFWSDGMVRVSGREYNGLIESPCYKGGEFSCLSCHSLHESEPNDQLSRVGKDNSACTQCHEDLRETNRLTDHTHHRPGSPGSECYNCHMPHTTYGVLKAIRGHQISNPNIADDVTTGRPNACNLCHLDKPLDWTASYLQQWYGQEKPRQVSSEISHSVDLALSGDAGQRALVAWHMGWPPALETSGTNWIAPILGQLLDDPYAAVRCVAERSLRTVSDLKPAGYDYVIDPRFRKSVREEVWKAWSAGSQAGEFDPARSRQLLVWPNDLKAQSDSFEERLKARNERAVRLRE